MKHLTNFALGAVAIVAAAAASAPAQARVSIGIGLGGYPTYYGPPGHVVCDPYSRWYDPYRCDAYYDDYYYGPVFIDGAWTNGPLRWRDFDGRREFFWHGGWHEGRGWRGSERGGRHHDWR